LLVELGLTLGFVVLFVVVLVPVLARFGLGLTLGFVVLAGFGLGLALGLVVVVLISPEVVVDPAALRQAVAQPLGRLAGEVG
jgi:hypothetical protein